MDLSRPALILAPHLEYPTRNGADISLDRVGLHLSTHLPYVDLVGARTITRFVQGEVQVQRDYPNTQRSRTVAALRTLSRRSHYLLEKFLTPVFRRTALQYLADPDYGTVLYSYICTATLTEQDPHPDRLRLVWTHNDQLKWFRDLRDAARNPVARLTAELSARWYFSFFERHAGDFTFLHVTESDREGHLAELPPHRTHLVPIGVDLPEVVPHVPRKDDTIRLMFVGSLAQKMNLDALRHFAGRFFPPLHIAFGDRLHVLVVGSHPAEGVRALCKEQSWHLHPNVSDDELARLYASASYAILPFPYATGAKLKLLGALAHGVPFLATTHVRAQLDEALPSCLLSNNPKAWVRQVRKVPYLAPEQRNQLREQAAAHSWAEVVERRMVEML